jgi:hypothetical protein
MTNIQIALRKLHPKQAEIKASSAKRKIVRAGRRGGKTTFAADESVSRFLDGQRVLYAVPTGDQLQKWWFEVTETLRPAIEANGYVVNQTMHTIVNRKTENRVRGKTAWNADTLRGDYADYLILDEVQLMDEDAWGVVGAPMLLDNNGDALFIYTPPSLHSRSVSKARDKGWISKFAKRHAQDPSKRWELFNFTSHDNPYISKSALAQIAGDMTALAYRQEIMAEDVEDVPGALWKRSTLDGNRIPTAPADLQIVVVGVDPSATSGGDEAGIIVAGTAICGCKGTPEKHGFVLADYSLQGSPATWAAACVKAYNYHKADRLIAESNQGGEMVALTIGTIANAPSVKLIHASRGKATRAEPIAALYEQGRVHHVGEFANLEDEMTQWIPGDASPNRMDALVWAVTELGLTRSSSLVGW